MSGRSEVYQCGLRPRVPVEVRALCVESPSLFWLSARTSISEQIGDYLAAGIQQEPLPASKLTRGSACVASREGQASRAVMDGVVEWETGELVARVVWVDVGGWGWVRVRSLRTMPPLMSFHPWQAFPCRLAGLKPADATATEWSAESVSLLRAALLDQPGNLHATALKPSEPHSQVFGHIATVEIYRKSGEDGESENVGVVLAMRHRQLFAFNKRNPTDIPSLPPYNAVCLDSIHEFALYKLKKLLPEGSSD